MIIIVVARGWIKMVLTHEDLNMKPVKYLEFSVVFSDGIVLGGLLTKASLNESDKELIDNINETGPPHWFEGGVKAVGIIRHGFKYFYTTDWHSEKEYETSKKEITAKKKRTVKKKPTPKKRATKGKKK
jgi:hypothetical protein